MGTLGIGDILQVTVEFHPLQTGDHSGSLVVHYDTAVGSCFTFLPQQGIIPPDGLQAISISFRTTIPGEFKEEFHFNVAECPKPVTLTIRCCAEHRVPLPPLSLKNNCCLPLSIVLDLKKPFLICDVDQQPLPEDAQPIKLDKGEEIHLHIQFNPAYKKDLYSWVAEKTLNMQFMEHPHEEQITIRGEVYFPNLHIQAKALDFGYIINGTEQVDCVAMTNCSPIPVHYHWSFQTDSQVNTISDQQVLLGL
ncbi:PREDICTED: hydrocephalus-inducing protein homolog [Lepidothrix coronata]|uniref:Hydrocephalus-inducing protein homolog n=1 Tax=Lepidothrix coronata TaxID=321398 RepID=A0A6J0I1F0_9PASS|nr:PREDICTED: hydrocephalus-inducing protein homolog [Lepidothrix coronata]